VSHLIEEARNLRVCADRLRDLGQRLPATTDEVVSTLETTIEAGDSDAFTALLLAALAAGHEIDASILRQGLALTRDALSLTIIVGHLAGDPANVILEIVHGERLAAEEAAHALLLAILWCRQRRIEPPGGIVSEARVLGRRVRFSGVLLMLACIAQEVDDEGLWEILGGALIDALAEDARAVRSRFASIMADPVLDGVPQEPPPLVHSGFTVRRAVARVGRNDPCPCGSGKKYKKCCYAEDQKRLSNPSDVAGVTLDELRQRPEQHLTRDRLLSMERLELTRLNPAEIEADLVPVLINELLGFREIRAAYEVFAVIGWSSNLAGHHLDAVESAAMDGDAELVRDLMALRPTSTEFLANLSIGVRLVLAGDKPGPMLQTVEEEAQRALRNSRDEPVDLAYGLLSHGCPGLGILVARGVIPLAGLLDAEVLLETVLETRDRLDLPPSDPIEEVLDTLTTRHEEWADTARLRRGLVAKQHELDEQDTEAARLRARLVQLQHEIEERRSAAVAVEPAVPTNDVEPAQDVDPEIDPEVVELRRRLASVKADLKQRHTERNELRRAVEGMSSEIEELRSKGAEPAMTDDLGFDQELDLLLPAEGMQSHPVRLAEFGAGFRSDLESSPKRVARSALRLVGGLCAGDPQAFSDACRIKLDRTLWRVRVGRKHRMLFRLDAGVVQALSLVPRADLERAIASLLRSAG